MRFPEVNAKKEIYDQLQVSQSPCLNKAFSSFAPRMNEMNLQICIKSTLCVIMDTNISTFSTKNPIVNFQCPLIYAENITLKHNLVIILLNRVKTMLPK